MPILRLALAQTNPTVGDFSANSADILAAVSEAWQHGADIVATGEMALSGYPIEDLATRPDFLSTARAHLDALARDIASSGFGQIPVIVGFPHGPITTVTHAAGGLSAETRSTADSPAAIAYNSAAVLLDGRVIGLYNKQELPNYSVFDEYRIFKSGHSGLVLHVADTDVAIVICEDIWREGAPIAQLKTAKPGLVIVINGSPFERDKRDVRIPLVEKRAAAVNAPFAYVNLVGGQDDLVFDGDSFVVNSSGKLLGRGSAFTPDLVVLDVDIAASHSRGHQFDDSVVVVDAGAGHPNRNKRSALVATDSTVTGSTDPLADVWNALVLGLRDYVDKNGFPSVVLGLSGGIDSAVCAAIATDALGPQRVVGVSLPSKYSSDHSRSDAADLAERLGIELLSEPIANLVAPVEEQLDLTGLAAENVQARLRAVVLMALSNKHGHLVITTGNKSEIAVGYSTIYGDSVGGFAPLKDVPKTLVWELARWRNAHALAGGHHTPIPENSILKPPSAELRPGQLDQDSLPEYEELDQILESYITHKLGRSDIVAQGHSAEVVDRIISLVDRAEWKRRQGAIGPKISEMAFGRDRRLPITFTHQ